MERMWLSTGDVVKVDETWCYLEHAGKLIKLCKSGERYIDSEMHVSIVNEINDAITILSSCYT